MARFQDHAPFPVGVRNGRCGHVWHKALCFGKGVKEMRDFAEDTGVRFRRFGVGLPVQEYAVHRDQQQAGRGDTRQKFGYFG